MCWHHASNRCRRVNRFVMASELFCLVLGFDFAHTIEHLLHEFIDGMAAIETYDDSTAMLGFIPKARKTV